MTFRYKIQIENTKEVRRLGYNVVPSWKDFSEALHSLASNALVTSFLSSSSVVLKYQDEEGDFIRIASQQEWEEAHTVLSSQPVKKLFLSIDKIKNDEGKSLSSVSVPVEKQGGGGEEKKEESLIDEDKKSPSSKNINIETEMNLQNLLENQQIRNLVKQFTNQEPEVLVSQLPTLLEMAPQFFSNLCPNTNNNNNNSNPVQSMVNQFLPMFQQGCNNNDNQAQGADFSKLLDNFFSMQSGGQSNIFGQNNDSHQTIPTESIPPPPPSVTTSMTNDEMYEEQLKTLQEMGFTDRETNKQFLVLENGDVSRVLALLLQG